MSTHGTSRVDQLCVGEKFLGPRDFHITVERVERISSTRTKVIGVNGWGEGFERVYNSRTTVELL